MSQRFLKIKNFKNIGVSKEEEYQILHLNNSLDKDKIGELIIIIGENNVGKSNILDAVNIINSISKKSENFKDYITDFMDYDECLPEIVLVCKENESNSNDLKLNINEKGDIEIKNNFTPIQTGEIEKELDLNIVIAEIKDKFDYTKSITEVIEEFDEDNKIEKLRNSFLSIVKSNENHTIEYLKFKKLYGELVTLINLFIKNYNEEYDEKYKYLQAINLDSIAYIEKPKVKYKIENHDINAIPNIVYYKQENIKDDELITTPKDIENSKFFNSLFKAIGKGISTITMAYEKDKRTRGHKDKFEETINKKLEEIVNKKFNELYFQDLGIQEYSFQIKLEKDEIYLSMQKNGQVSSLFQQSTGFKWFFDFFFNFLYANELNAGDIVLMDEPEVHLANIGKKDLRKFIKKFAKDTGITFICTTHHEKFVDIDYLDELRIIKHKKDKVGVEIQSDFSAIADEEVDTLDGIVSSFGIKRGDIARDDKIIFVEGITDYNYLTAFKLLREKKENKKFNLIFLPIGGLGKDDKEMKEKLNKLSQIEHNGKGDYAFVLTDSDSSGEKFKKLCEEEKYKNKILVISLKEAGVVMYESDKLTDDKNNKIINQIENIFSKEYIEEHLDMLKSKSSGRSSLFKKYIEIENEELDEKTITNFNKLLDYLKSSV